MVKDVIRLQCFHRPCVAGWSSVSKQRAEGHVSIPIVASSDQIRFHRLLCDLCQRCC